MMYLEKDTCTIAEVAYNTGFNDPVYFARIFKQKTGLTPKQYRQDPSSVHSQGGEEQHGT
jgi:AraC-like DNA-binding protein